MCAIKRLKRKEENVKESMHTRTGIHTCYNITAVQFDRGLACKKIIQSSKNKQKQKFTPVLEHPNIKTEQNRFTQKSHSCSCNGWGRRDSESHRHQDTQI